VRAIGAEYCTHIESTCPRNEKNPGTRPGFFQVLIS
jgi:hypothetical protein